MLFVSTGVKPFICTDTIDCPHKFGDSSALTRHRKSKHGYVPKSGKSSSTPAPTSTMPSSSSETTSFSPPPSLHDSSNSPPWNMSDVDLFIHFLADMEQLDSLEVGLDQQVPFQQFI
jgi:hypothetical protein